MKGWVGFFGRLAIVYGIPALIFVLAYDSPINGWLVMIFAVVWMFVFHFVTKNWENWGNNE